MRRIAEEARERQSREEAARREAEMPKTLEDFKQLAKRRKREKLLAEGATLRQVPALSKTIVGGFLSGVPQQFKGFSDLNREHPDIIQRIEEWEDLRGRRLSNSPTDFAKNLRYFYQPESSFLGKIDDGYLTQDEKMRLFDLLNKPHEQKGWNEIPFNRNYSNFLMHDYTKLRPIEEGVLPNYFKTGFFKSDIINSQFRKPLNRQKEKLLTDAEYQRYMDRYRYHEQKYNQLLDRNQEGYDRAMEKLRLQERDLPRFFQNEREREAQWQRDNQRAQQVAREYDERMRAQQQAEAARKAQQQAEATNSMQTYRQLISNMSDSSVFPYAAINYAMTGQKNLPANLSTNQQMDLYKRLHPDNINNFSYLSQHNPSLNLAQELQYLRNLAESRTISASRAQAQSLNDAIRSLLR